MSNVSMAIFFATCFRQIMFFCAKNNFSSHLATMAIGSTNPASQITCNCFSKVFNAFNVFKVTSLQGIWSMDLLDPFSCQLHHIAFDMLKSHTPLPCPGTQSINIPLKFHCVFFIFNFTIANTVISKKSYFRLSIWWDVIYVQRKIIRDQERCPGGHPTKPEPSFTPFTTARCCLKQRKESIHFNVLPPIP